MTRLAKGINRNCVLQVWMWLRFTNSIQILYKFILSSLFLVFQTGANIANQGVAYFVLLSPSQWVSGRKRVGYNEIYCNELNYTECQFPQ